MQPQVETVHVPDWLVFQRRMLYSQGHIRVSHLDMRIGCADITKIGFHNIKKVAEYLDTDGSKPPKTEDTEIEAVD